jgi:inosine/xanthosine triphosphatase
MKKIALGTISENKQRILAAYLKVFQKDNEYIIVPCDVASDIADQPLSEEITITGAINRAQNALRAEPISDYGMGLEAGLVEVEDLGYFLVCVCALLKTDEAIHLGISGKIPLPIEVSRIIKAGDSFGKTIREFQNTCNDGAKKEWAKRLISRECEFSDAICRAFFSLNAGL